VSVEVVLRIADAVLSARVTVPRSPAEGLVFLLADGVTQPSRAAQQALADAVAAAALQAGFAVARPAEPDVDARRDHDHEGVTPPVPELVDRLVALTRWARRDPRTVGLPVGYFATSTAAAAALHAAAELDGEVAAVVSAHGRPDLASQWAPDVTAATLLIVGGADPVGLDRNGAVEPLLRCPRGLEILTGAGRRLSEPAAVDRVVELTLDWFGRHLAGRRLPAPGTVSAPRPRAGS